MARTVSDALTRQTMLAMKSEAVLETMFLVVGNCRDAHADSSRPDHHDQGVVIPRILPVFSHSIPATGRCCHPRR